MSNYWQKIECDNKGRVIYFEDSDSKKEITIYKNDKIFRKTKEYNKDWSCFEYDENNEVIFPYGPNTLYENSNDGYLKRIEEFKW